MISSAEAARMIRALLRRDGGLLVGVEFLDSGGEVCDRLPLHPTAYLRLSSEAMAYYWCFGERPHAHRVAGIRNRGDEWTVETTDACLQLVVSPLRSERDWLIVAEWRKARRPAEALREVRDLFKALKAEAREERSRQPGGLPQWVENLPTPGGQGPMPGRRTSRSRSAPHKPRSRGRTR